MQDREPRDDRGAVAIMFAMVALTLFIVAGFVVDLAYLRDGKQQAQGAADASALAAGNALYPGPDVIGAQYGAATTAAEQLALANWGVPISAWSACSDSAKLSISGSGAGTVPSPGVATDCVSFSASAGNTHIRVLLPTRIFKTAFGGLSGTADHGNHVLSAASGSEIVTGGASDCGLCVIGSATHAIGNGNIDVVAGAGAYFDGNVSSGPNSSVQVSSGAIKVEGTISGSTSHWYSPAGVQTNQPHIDDPLAGVPLPPSTQTPLTAKVDPCNDGPGVYGSFRFSQQTVSGNTSTCTLQSGVYIIQGSSASWSLNGNANVVGSNVTLYFTCGPTVTGHLYDACPPNTTGAGLDLTGNGSFNISAPLSGSNYGMAVIYDRNNKANLSLVGNGTIRLSGTVYAASGTLSLSGNGCTATDPHYDSLFVVSDLAMNGNNACLYLTYNSSHNVQKLQSDLHLEY